MKPKQVMYGDRYADDSGWERQVEACANSGTIDLVVGAMSIQFDASELPWVLHSLRAAGEAVGFDTETQEAPNE